MSAPNKNMTFLKPLLFLTGIWCGFPQYQVKVLRNFNKTFAVLRVLLWTLLGLAGICKEIMLIVGLCQSGNMVLITVPIMGVLLHGLCAVFSLTINVSFGFAHVRGIGRFFKNMDQIDFILDFQLGKVRWQFYVHFFVFCLMQFIHGYCSSRLWHLPLGHTVFRLYIIRILQIFQFSLVVLTTNILCHQLYQRFRVLNRQLRKFEEEIYADKNYRFFMFKELKKIHLVLCDQVDAVNDLFGLSLFLFFLTCVVLICYFVVHLLTLAASDSHYSLTQKIQLFAVCLSGILFVIIELVFLACAGALLAAETSRTHRITYGLLNTLPQPFHPGVDQLFLKEVENLAFQSAFRQPFVSACGIFKVDFRIVGAVIGSVTTYIIIAQQFQHQIAAAKDHY